MTDDQLRIALRATRRRIVGAGKQHAMWDVVFDGEALLDNKPTLLTRRDVETLLAQFLSRQQ